MLLNAVLERCLGAKHLDPVETSGSITLRFQDPGIGSLEKGKGGGCEASCKAKAFSGSPQMYAAVI